jgi:hypothetical protein
LFSSIVSKIRHPERSSRALCGCAVEGPLYWHLLFLLSFPQGTCFCLCRCLFHRIRSGLQPTVPAHQFKRAEGPTYKPASHHLPTGSNPAALRLNRPKKKLQRVALRR